MNKGTMNCRLGVKIRCKTAEYVKEKLDIWTYGTYTHFFVLDSELVSSDKV